MYRLLIVFILFACHKQKNKIVEPYKGEPIGTVKINTAPHKDTVLNPVYYSIMFREGFSSKIYTCPAGQKAQGFGQSNGFLKTQTLCQAQAKLKDTMQIYFNTICNTYPNLTPVQVWAVVSIAMNCKWNSIFTGNFHKSLASGKIPSFEKYCYYTTSKGKKIKSYNLLQSRLYEKALFTHGMTDNSFMWVNPYRNYSDELVTITDLYDWYEQHYQDRIK